MKHAIDIHIFISKIAFRTKK